MAAVTVTGSVGGVPISFATNTALQTAVAQAIIAAASGPTGALIQGGSSTLTSAFTVDISPTGGVITGFTGVAGNPGVTNAFVALDGQNDVYITGGNTLTPTFSTVVAADNSNSSIVNSNALGGLTAVTGAGGNTLLGLAGANNFTTGNGGSDVVYLNGASNTLTSNGADAVLVGGPSTISAASGGIDSVLMTTGTTLAFINGSRAGIVDSITGAANGAIVVAGPGATSITSGIGPEAFFVDTSAGNTTLNGNLAANDSFTFVKDANVGSANVVVNNFTSSDVVGVHGYAGVQFTIGANAAGSAVLSLTDGSTVTFNNVSAAQLAAQTKPV